MDKPLKILLVEDNPADAQLVLKQLKREKIDFAEELVENQDQYVQALANMNPDIILSDYTLPRFDGMQALLIRNELKPNIPFILVTGSVNEDVAVKCMKSGADDYIIKKNYYRLGEAIRAAISKRELIARKEEVEKELQRSREEFRLYFENAAVGMSVTSPDRSFLEINKTLCEMTGYSKEELTGKKWTDITYHEDLDKNMILFQEALDGLRDNYALDKRFIRKDGSLVNVALSVVCIRNEDGSVKHFLSSYLDITERIKLEENIRQERMMLRTLLDNLPNPIYFLDRYGKKILTNKADIALAGLTKPEEVLYKTDLELYPGEIGERGHADNIFVLETGMPIINREEYFFDRNNRKRWHLTSKFPLKDASGAVQGLVGIGHDITERKLFENEMVKAKEKAEESDRLKTAFLQNISHEIRTPLNAIVGFSTLLNEEDIDQTARKSYAEMIVQSSNHLLSVISDIVDISNIEANIVKINKSETDIGAILASVKRQFENAAWEKGLQFIVDNKLNEDERIIITDKARFTQILINLVNNAVKFTDKGHISVVAEHKDSNIRVTVSDTGIGIPPEFHARIFERFFKVPHAGPKLYEGTGLGLAISKAYAGLLGGNLTFSSRPEAGSSFVFTVPYIKPVAEIKESTQPGSEQNQSFREKKRILIAEDIDSNYKLLTYFIRDINAEHVRARNGKEAVEICKRGENFDLILMDIKMPEMDGYTAARLIRELYPNVPIIAQTAYADEREQVMNSGFNAYISKPFDKKRLLSVIFDLVSPV
ncbi:MAG TPA: response regulator [Bacteroidales bacterium]|nr:response regulator [Bacteroidales bacterium]